MRKTTLLLSIMVLAAMVLAACGGGATSTNVSPTQLPVTSVATEPSTATEMPTATEAPITTETPGVPVTGGQAAPAGRMSERLKFQVMDQAGNKLGTVSDLVLDLSKAQVVYVIVNAAGKKVAVPRAMFTVQTGSSTGTGTGLSTSTPSASSSGTGLSTSTPAGVATGQSGTGSTGTGSAMGSSTSTPSAGTGSSGTGTGTGSSMGGQATAFILQADPTMLKNAPAFDDKNMPGLGVSPDSWDIAIRDYWNGGGAGSSNSNTPSPVGTAVTDMTPTTTGGSTGLSTETPSASTGSAGLSTSTPSVPVTGSTGMGQGAITIQGVVLASQVIGAKVTVGMPSAGTGTGGTGTSSSTSTPGAGTSSSTSTPSAGMSSSTSTPSASGAGSSTSTPSAGSSTGTGTGSSTGTGTAMTVSGTIADLLVDNSGTVLYIVLRTTGAAGALIPVPLHFLQLDSNNNFVLNIDPAMLQSAPSFTSDQFPDMSTSGWDSQFSSFWQSNGTSGGSGSGSGATATATP